MLGSTVSEDTGTTDTAPAFKNPREDEAGVRREGVEGYVRICKVCKRILLQNDSLHCPVVATSHTWLKLGLN